ncbi:type-1 restriction enzyme EcoAI specificity protein [Geobacter sp. OR-1]|uniref:restriction endonuclease subunit S n=1 Tax=Geobacter sp. OR-1 TaxID=1266765 RepID=UPI000541A0A4|nr:restriction endonuclease subunit S [Geobacter sp. OR-1]GAM09122.1 type-1 restriction enzyme EcoAI specificity protein [Geobacter sp. OR-1]
MKNDFIGQLSSIAEVISGFAFKSSWFGSGMEKVVRISDFDNGVVTLTNAVSFDAKKHPVSSKYQIQSGDILVALSGATVGKVGVASTEAAGAYLNQRVAIVRGHNPDNTSYLSFILRSIYMLQLLPSAEGAAQPNLSPKFLESLPIPIPQIEDQRRIAASLKSQLAAVEEARNAAKTQLDELVNLANAIIRKSVEHSDTGLAKLGDVLDEVKKGIGTTWADYPVLGATRAGLALAKEPVGKSPERYKPVLHGTVFYNPMRIMIGSIAMVDDDDTPGITSPDYVALRGKPGLVDSRWFYYWLRSPYGVSCIASLARGAVRERMLFNRLAEGSIELPPFDVQIAASKALAELKPMRCAIEKQMVEINLLPGKILAKAFDITV